MARTELVNDMKLNAEVHPDGSTSHYTYAQGTAGRWPKAEIWKRGKILGSGGFGVVWVEQCVSSQGPGRLRAVKMIKKEPDPSKRAYCDQELEAIAKFSQPKYSHLFVKSFGWFENTESIFITMEHIDLRDLQRQLTGPIPETEAQQICSQLLHGVQCLHDNKFVHRDLKPQNVFVKSKGPRWHVKIGDFGISKRYNESGALQTKVGTDLYFAPEVLGMYPPGRKPPDPSLYTNRVDIWSLGVMLFYLLSREYPFPNGKSLSFYVRNSHFPSLGMLQSVTQEGQNFLRRLLTADATVRLSAKEALEEGWLKQPSFDLVSGISRIAISEKLTAGQGLIPAVPSPMESTHEASRGWDDEDVSSAMIDEQTIRAAQGPQSRLSARQKSTSFKQAPISDSLDDLNTSHNEGLLLLSRKQYADAQRMFQEAFELRKHAFGTHHEDTLASLSSLGDALFDQEKYAEAEVVYQDVWMRRKRALGESHPDTLRSLYKLGKIFYGKEKFAKAEGLYRDAWGGQKRALGEDCADALDSLNALGEALLCQDKDVEAEGVLRDAWEGRKRVLGEYCEDTLDSLSALGEALFGQEKYVEAEGVHRDAWEGRKRVLGEYSKDTLGSLSDLGDALTGQEKYVEAEGVHRDAWEGRKRVLGEYCEDTLESLTELGDALTGQEKYVEAECVHRDAWEGLKQVLGEDRRETLASLDSLGKALWLQGKHTEAEEVYRKVCKGRERLLGTQDKVALWSLVSLGQVLQSQEKYNEAEALYQQAWKGLKEAFGANDEATLVSLLKLAQAIEDQAKYTKAEAIYRQIWEGRKEVHGANHEDTFSSLQSLIFCLFEQDKYAKAERLQRQLYESHREVFGSSHKDTLTSLHTLGIFLDFQRKYAEAEDAFREAWKGRKEAFGANHTDTLDSLKCLRYTLRDTSPLPKPAGKTKRSLRKSLNSFWG